MTGTLHENQYTFSIIFRSILLRMKNFSEKKNYSETQNTHFIIVFVFESSTALARTRTLGRSSSINRYKQHDMLPHHRA